MTAPWKPLAGLGLLLLASVVPAATADEPKTFGEVAEIRIVLVGDSTMATYLNPPPDRPDLTGWGQVLGEFFSDRVTIDNHAKSGRSSKSFINEGLWKKALAQKADYVFIQFGHNDASNDPKRMTDPDTGFQDYLRQYIDEARASGAQPVLITPVGQRTFKDQKAFSRHRPYAEAMFSVGKEKQVPVLDLNAASVAMLDRIGEADSADLFPSKKDRTHFSRKGALAIAELAVRGLPEVVPELKAYAVPPSSRSKNKKATRRE